MGLSVVIPVRDIPECTDECIDLLIKNSRGDIDIIVIDNGSYLPYIHHSPFVRVIRNDNNIGFWPSMVQGIEAAHYDIVLTMHNDVHVYSPAYDQLILKEFKDDPLLSMAGFFGARGLGYDGSRGHPESNMLGKRYGTHGKLHGYLQTGTHPATIFDSLSMIIDRNKLNTFEYRDIPPHHWTDRILCLRMVLCGYHMLTIGIEFDHGGSFTAVGTNALNTFTEDWCKERGLEFNQSWDHTLYMYGLKQFQREWEDGIGSTIKELWIDKDFQLMGVAK